MSDLLDLTLRDSTNGQPPRKIASGYRGWLIALAIHALVIGGLLLSRPHLVQIGQNAVRGTIGAFVMEAPQPTATTGRAAPEKARPRRVTTRPQPAESPEDGSSGAAEAAPQGGPVRLVPGQQAQLLKKVEPVYPPLLSAAHIQGIVVLDAVILRDGSIGDVTVVKSAHPAFDQSAIQAVKQWRYAPLPYDGILTVTVNFTLRS